MVLSRGQRDVVTLVSERPHLVLVHNSPDETIVSRVLAGRRSREQGLLLAVEAVGRGLDSLGGRGEAVGEEGGGQLAEPGERVVALVQRDLDVQPRDVLPAGAVGEVLALALLFQQVGGHVSAAGELRGAILLDVANAGVLAAAETDAGVLAFEHGQVGRGPFLRAGAVGARADDVDEDDDQDDWHDEELLVEVGDGRALPHAVPRSVRAVDIGVVHRGRASGGSCCGGGARGDGRGSVRGSQRRGCSREVGKV